MRHNHWRRPSHEGQSCEGPRAMRGGGEGFGRGGFGGRFGDAERTGRGGGRRRMFEGGELRLVILL
ncbi:MAG: hypothetical protein WAK01_08965, partial [Methylocystis sp.]